MLKILNKIAWTVSLTAGFVIIMLVGIFFDFFDYGDAFDNDAILFWIFGIWFFGGLFKKLFLSKDLIELSIKHLHLSQEKVEVIKERRVDHEKDIVKERVVEAVSEKILTKEELPITELKPPKPEFKLSADKEEESEIIPEKPGLIKSFFAENALAKIGGILLFLGVLFLLQLVYNQIGPVGKIMIGFAFGFALFFVGMFLEKKGHSKESRILFGVSILINYLVILSGRYLITENLLTNQVILSEGLTFLLLIVNTIFAVVVSLVYNSSALLTFAFVVAYLNPFLIDAQPANTPYTLLGYGLVVSLGAIVLSNYFKEKLKNYSSTLLNTAFIGGNVLFLLAPFTTTTHWLVKLTTIGLLSLLCVFIAYHNNQKQNIGGYFFGAYLFLSFLLTYGNYKLDNLFLGLDIFVGYMAFLISMIVVGAIMFYETALALVFYVLGAPFLILLSLVYFGIFTFGGLSFALVIFMILYLGFFAKSFNKLTSFMHYAFFTCLGVFVFLISTHLSNIIDAGFKASGFSDQLVNVQVYGVIITTFLFLFTAYYFSTKKDLEYLYALGTVFVVVMLIPIIQRAGSLKLTSIISVVAVVVSSMILPFINRSLLQSRISNLVIGMATGAIFASGNIFFFLFGDTGQSKVTLGLSFLSLAVVYFFLSLAMYKKLGAGTVVKELSGSDHMRNNNIIYTFIAISVSLFSLSIAYVFSQYPQVVSAVWLFETSVMFYFYSRVKEFKIYLAGIILMAIGLLKVFSLLFLVQPKDFFTLISVVVIFISLIVNLKFLEDEDGEHRFIYDVGHIIGIGLMALILIKIIPSHHHGWSIFGTAAFSLILSAVYSLIYSAKIKYVFVAGLLGVFIYQIISVESIFFRLDSQKLTYLKILQHLSTIFFVIGVYMFNKVVKEINLKNKEADFLKALNFATSLYLLVITTQYVYYFFNQNEFVITIYWGLLAFLFLNFGIQKSIIRYRTIGLYILTLTVGKIMLYDIWSGLDDAVMRVVALILVGGLMIGISVLYTKKYGGNLKGEFDFENLTN